MSLLKTKATILILALAIVLGLGFFLQSPRKISEMGWGKIERGERPTLRGLISYVNQKRAELPLEFQKEVEEMKTDLARLGQEFWQRIGQAAAVKIEAFWQKTVEFWQRTWPRIKEEIKNIWEVLSFK